MTTGCPRVGLLLATVLPLALAASTAHAYGRGIDVADCTGCHTGGRTPRVRVTPTPAMPPPASTVRFRVEVEALNGGVGGFRIASSGPGSFRTVEGQGTRLLGEDTVVHSTPRSASGGWVAFEVDWLVPSGEGDAQFVVGGMSADGNGRSSGDSGSTTRASLVWGCAGATFYGDLDGDGVGAESRGSIQACEARDGWSTRSDDCDDNDGGAYPGATEVCNRRDDDCDGTSDEGVGAVLLYPDLDGDGYGGRSGEPVMGCDRPGYGIGNDDCDDRDPTAHPDADEVCGGRDEDCDGRVDERVRPVCGLGMCARASLTCDAADCVPGEPGSESCNAWDDDCDGNTDEGVRLCALGETCQAGVCVPEGTVPRDGGTGGLDGSTSPGPVSGGCAVTGARTSAGIAALGLALAIVALGRRRARR